MVGTDLGTFMRSWRALSQSATRPCAHERRLAERPGVSLLLPRSAQTWGHAGFLSSPRVKRLSSRQVHREGRKGRPPGQQLAGAVESGSTVSGGGSRVGIMGGRRWNRGRSCPPCALLSSPPSHESGASGGHLPANRCPWPFFPALCIHPRGPCDPHLLSNR